MTRLIVSAAALALLLAAKADAQVSLPAGIAQLMPNSGVACTRTLVFAGPPVFAGPVVFAKGC